MIHGLSEEEGSLAEIRSNVTIVKLRFITSRSRDFCLNQTIVVTALEPSSRFNFRLYMSLVLRHNYFKRDNATGPNS